MANTSRDKAINQQKLSALSYRTASLSRDLIGGSTAKAARTLALHHQRMHAEHAAAARAHLWALLGYNPWE